MLCKYEKECAGDFLLHLAYLYATRLKGHNVCGVYVLQDFWEKPSHSFGNITPDETIHKASNKSLGHINEKQAEVRSTQRPYLKPLYFQIKNNGLPQYIFFFLLNGVWSIIHVPKSTQITIVFSFSNTSSSDLAQYLKDAKILDQVLNAIAMNDEQASGATERAVKVFNMSKLKKQYGNKGINQSCNLLKVLYYLFVGPLDLLTVAAPEALFSGLRNISLENLLLLRAPSTNNFTGFKSDIPSYKLDGVNKMQIDDVVCFFIYADMAESPTLPTKSLSFGTEIDPTKYFRYKEIYSLYLASLDFELVAASYYDFMEKSKMQFDHVVSISNELNATMKNKDKPQWNRLHFLSTIKKLAALQFVEHTCFYDNFKTKLKLAFENNDHSIHPLLRLSNKKTNEKDVELATPKAADLLPQLNEDSEKRLLIIKKLIDNLVNVATGTYVDDKMDDNSTEKRKNSDMDRVRCSSPLKHDSDSKDGIDRDSIAKRAKIKLDQRLQSEKIDDDRMIMIELDSDGEEKETVFQKRKLPQANTKRKKLKRSCSQSEKNLKEDHDKSSNTSGIISLEAPEGKDKVKRENVVAKNQKLTQGQPNRIMSVNGGSVESDQTNTQSEGLARQGAQCNNEETEAENNQRRSQGEVIKKEISTAQDSPQSVQKTEEDIFQQSEIKENAEENQVRKTFNFETKSELPEKEEEKEEQKEEEKVNEDREKGTVEEKEDKHEKNQENETEEAKEKGAKAKETKEDEVTERTDEESREEGKAGKEQKEKRVKENGEKSKDQQNQIGGHEQSTQKQTHESIFKENSPSYGTTESQFKTKSVSRAEESDPDNKLVTTEYNSKTKPAASGSIVLLKDDFSDLSTDDSGDESDIVDIGEDVSAQYFPAQINTVASLKSPKVLETNKNTVRANSKAVESLKELGGPDTDKAPQLSSKPVIENVFKNATTYSNSCPQEAVTTRRASPGPNPLKTEKQPLREDTLERSLNKPKEVPPAGNDIEKLLPVPDEIRFLQELFKVKSKKELDDIQKTVDSLEKKRLFLLSLFRFWDQLSTVNVSTTPNFNLTLWTAIERLLENKINMVRKERTMLNDQGELLKERLNQEKEMVMQKLREAEILAKMEEDMAISQLEHQIREEKRNIERLHYAKARSARPVHHE